MFPGWLRLNSSRDLADRCSRIYWALSLMEEIFTWVIDRTVSTYPK
jgi:hypothetical protein